MAFDPDLASAISTIPTQYGVDPDYVRKMAVAESGGALGANAATSSAAGPYQIIGSTADSLGISRADRYDPQIATDAISRFTADNAAGLQKAGFDTSHGNLYLSHFAGLGGAKSVLGADPSTPVSDLLPSSSITANPFLRGMSAGDLTSWAARKVGGTAPVMTMPGASSAPGRFGLGGVGQSAMPQVDPLTGQSVPASADGTQAPQSGAYDDVASLLKGIAPKQAQQNGQGGGQSQRGGGMQIPQDPGARAMSLGQARQQFDPSRFYAMLPRRTGGLR